MKWPMTHIDLCIQMFSKFKTVFKWKKDYLEMYMRHVLIILNFIWKIGMGKIGDFGLKLMIMITLKN